MDEHDTTPGPRVSRDEMRDLTRLRRHGQNRHVAGVAGGLGRHLDIDPVILRVAFVVLTFFGGAGVLLYGAAWLLVPEDGDDSAVIDLDPRTRSFALLGAGLVGVLMTVGDSWGLWGFPWPLLVIGLIAVVLIRKREQDRGTAPVPPASEPGTVGMPAGPPIDVPAPFDPTSLAPTDDPAPSDPARAWYEQQPYAQQPFTPPPTGPAPTAAPPKPRRRGPLLFWVSLPLIAVALGILGIVQAAGVAVAPAAYPALALTVIGGLLVLGAWWGRAGGLIALGLLTAVAVGGAATVGQYDGETIRLAPVTAAEVPPAVDFRAGDVQIDLTEVADPEALAGESLTVEGAVGRIEVIVPEGLDIDITTQVNGPGGATLLDRETGGINVGLQRTVDDDPDVAEFELSATLSVGEVVVRHPE